MSRHGLGPDKDLILRTEISRNAGAAAVDSLCCAILPPPQRSVDADVIALGILWALNERGLRPGRDFAVVGH